MQVVLSIALLYPNSNASEAVYPTFECDQHFENILLSYKSIQATDNSNNFKVCTMNNDFKSFLEPRFYICYII